MTAGEIGSIKGNADASGELYPRRIEEADKKHQDATNKIAANAVANVVEIIPRQEGSSPPMPIHRMPSRGSFA